jgi:hypothetical protein
MSTRPQTLYGLADSPVDLAAFLLDHGDGTGQPGLVTHFLDGTLHSDLTPDDLLDNITLYWLTNTGISAARLYWENTAGFFDAKPITIPYAISVFPHELYQAPRSWAKRAYPTTSSTPTTSTAAATSPPGNNPNSSPKNSKPPSDHSGSRYGGRRVAVRAVPATQGSQPATGRRAALVVGASLSARAQGEGISPDGAGMPDPQQHDGAPSLLVLPTISIENLAFACGHDVRVHRHDNLA